MAQDERTAASPQRSVSAVRAGRVALIFWVLTALAFVTAYLFGERSFASDILIGSIDQGGFAYLAMLATAACFATAILTTTYALTRPPEPIIVPSAFAAVTVLVLCLAALGAYPALMLGALTFSTTYRTIGVVGGREVVVGQRVGLGERSMQAGLRDGLSVDFSTSTGDELSVSRTKFEDVQFQISEGADSVRIVYTPGPLPSKAQGVLMVPK